MAVACLVALTACGDEDAPVQTGGEGPGDGDAAALVGREFISDRVEGRDLVAGTEITLRLDEGELSASAGCNSLGGPYHLEGFDDTNGVLAVDANGLAMTEIGCDPERHAQDSWLQDLLLADPTVTVADEDTMTLTDGGSTIHFVDREVADPDRPLVGTEWRVDTILAGDAASSVPEGSTVTFVFGDDGRLVVASDQCTSVELSFEEDDGTITFGTYGVDDIACPSPWSETLALLDAGTAAFTIDHARLTLSAPDGNGVSLTAGAAAIDAGG